MKKHKEALYCLAMAQEVAECVKARLPEGAEHQQAVLKLVLEQLSPNRQVGRFRVILGGLGAVLLLCGSAGQLQEVEPIAIKYDALVEIIANVG